MFASMFRDRAENRLFWTWFMRVDDDAHNKGVLTSIQKAKELNPANPNIKNEDSRHLAFLQSEQEWARKMLIKVQGLSGVMRLN